MFDEHSDEAVQIMYWFENMLEWSETEFKIHYDDPLHDIARRFLNEIIEFKPIGE